MKALRAQSKARTHAKLVRWMGGKTAGGAKSDVEDSGKPKSKRAPSEPVSVEGTAARPRLDRPGRKMGGRACKADGGWTGEGDSGKALKERSAAEDAKAVRDLKMGTAKSVVGGALTGFSRGILGKGLGIGAGIDGVNDIGNALSRSTKARRMNEEADKQEGRKRGGKVSK